MPATAWAEAVLPPPAKVPLLSVNVTVDVSEGRVRAAGVFNRHRDSGTDIAAARRTRRLLHESKATLPG